ncbi:hypothetical protein OQJ26_12175 [Legionella sp. PATHC038]|uniref:hypothetical protein n=1 Tax=Legionella sheltonii TaxID=2992041 RepID=UPI00224424FE|nr:hypothetical protein [Legionella sp. PATHC038]MCW8399549.1 hypothetical protein [Legionella sp. PATHC038]
MLAAWYQNRHQVACKAQKSNLGLILQAVKVGFKPGIVEFTVLLTSSPDYAFAAML